MSGLSWCVGDWAERIEDHILVKAGERHQVTEMFRGGYLGFARPVGGEWNPAGWRLVSGPKTSPASEPKAPASDLDAAVGRVTKLADIRELGARTEARHSAFGDEREPYLRQILSGATVIVSYADLRLILSALSSQSQATEGMAKALEAARKFMVFAINEAMPGMDFDPAEHLTVKQIDAALSHYRTLGGE